MISKLTNISRIVVVGLNSYLLFKKKERIFFCENNKFEEKVFLFGDKRCLMQDLKENGEASFFEKNGIKVKKITFGNGIGSCVTENDEIYIWGSYKDENKNEIIYVNPIKLKSNDKFTDIEFSNNDIYIVNKNGELKIIRNYSDCLKKNEFIIEQFYKCNKNLFFENEKIIKLSVNKYHLAFVTNKGNLYCSGNNFYGQCGLNPSLKNNFNLNYNFEFLKKFNGSFSMRNDNHSEREVPAQNMVHNNSDIRDTSNINSSDNVQDISNKMGNISLSSENNEFHSKNIINNYAFIGKEENLIEKGIKEKVTGMDNITEEDETIEMSADKSNYIKLNKISFGEKTQIIDVSCGLNHTICLDNNDNVYSFGDDSKIQLGLGESRTNKNSLSGTQWKEQLKRGYSTITKNLVNYSFYDRHIQSSPQKILKKMNDCEMCDKIYKINAGSKFSMIYSNDKFGKQLFCFGDNMYFQCGRHLGKHQQTLSTVKLPNNKIKDFSCGDRHCLLNLNGKLYGWGYNNMYQITPFKNKGIVNNPIHILSQNKYPIDYTHIKYINAKYNNSAVVITTK
ncbi:regulator of chromosome condensation, putative [Plasmodium vinckei brucechwatti]|uniref:Regulator of chromosome condensation, putative n=1 Tax=Plasmodium vinckei brucechwatti TaxID=119398 RepID=A0A6V7S0Y4_PLAVN|nr:regulator of chromosome condensation, putative [Plasmodium vinckei brucechwatti]